MHNNRMLKRKQNWDYRQRCIYMITLTVEKWRPFPGRMTGGRYAQTVPDPD